MAEMHVQLPADVVPGEPRSELLKEYTHAHAEKFFLVTHGSPAGWPIAPQPATLSPVEARTTQNVVEGVGRPPIAPSA